MENDFEEVRARIDRIDEELVRLLNDRQAVSIEIGKLKKARQSELHVPDREREILDRLNSISDGPLGEAGLNQIYREILSVSREAQRRIREEDDE